MKTLFNLFVLLSISFVSYGQLSNFVNDSTIKRYEVISDSLIKQREKYYSFAKFIENQFKTKTFSTDYQFPYANPGFKVIKDSVQICRNCPFDMQTRYIVYDNGGLDIVLDSIKGIIDLIGNDYYLGLVYNKDSILNQLDFLYYPTPTAPKREHLSYKHEVNTIEIIVNAAGELESYMEKAQSIIIRNYTFNRICRSCYESYAMDTVRINGSLKQFEVYYRKSKVTRMYISDAFTDFGYKLLLLSSNAVGKYSEIEIRNNSQLIYEEYNGPFWSGHMLYMSSLDSTIYYYYFYNYIGKVTSFSVRKEYKDYSHMNIFHMRNGRIRDTEEKVNLNSR